jgi:hypothetical protein
MGEGEIDPDDGSANFESFALAETIVRSQTGSNQSAK